jgi:hypothetical protein
MASVSAVLSVPSQLVSVWRTPAKVPNSGGKRLPLGKGGQAAALVSVTIDEAAFLYRRDGLAE